MSTESAQSDKLIDERQKKDVICCDILKFLGNPQRNSSYYTTSTQTPGWWKSSIAIKTCCSFKQRKPHTLEILNLHSGQYYKLQNLFNHLIQDTVISYYTNTNKKKGRWSPECLFYLKKKEHLHVCDECDKYLSQCVCVCVCVCGGGGGGLAGGETMLRDSDSPCINVHVTARMSCRIVHDEECGARSTPCVLMWESMHTICAMYTHGPALTV